MKDEGGGGLILFSQILNKLPKIVVNPAAK